MRLETLVKEFKWYLHIEEILGDKPNASGLPIAPADSEQAQLRYAFSRLSGAAFDQVGSYLDEDTGTINFGTLNEFLVNIRAVYDSQDRAWSRTRKILVYPPAMRRYKTSKQFEQGSPLGLFCSTFQQAMPSIPRPD
jgi:hypothetical protein